MTEENDKIIQRESSAAFEEWRAWPNPAAHVREAIARGAFYTSTAIEARVRAEVAEERGKIVAEALMAAREDLVKTADRLRAKAREAGDKTHFGTAAGVSLACLRLVELADRARTPDLMAALKAELAAAREAPKAKPAAVAAGSSPDTTPEPASRCGVCGGQLGVQGCVRHCNTTPEPASECSCELLDVGRPGRPEFILGRPDGCPVHGAEVDAQVATAKRKAREGS